LSASTLIEHGLSATSLHFADGWLNKIANQEKQLTGAGFSELSTIRNLKNGLKPPFSGFHAASWSDGLAMRCAPIGIAAYRDYSIAIELVRSDGAVSNAGEGILGGIAVALAVAMAMNQVPTMQIISNVIDELPEESWLYRNLEKVVELASKNTNLSKREMRHKLLDELAVTDFPFPEMAPEAVSLAFAALILNEEDFKETLLFAVNLGRDTDTIAAISGAILGAKVGYKALPDKWTKQLKPATGSCLEFAKGIDLIELAPALIELGSKS